MSSRQISGKNSENKINLPWKSFSKICCSESTAKLLVSPLTYKIKAYNMSGVRI